MWKGILQEGEMNQPDNIHLIHIPSKETINLEPKAPTGYKIREFGPMDQNEIFEEILSTAIKAYKIMAGKGRNMSSMVTPNAYVGEKRNQTQIANVY